VCERVCVNVCVCVNVVAYLNCRGTLHSNIPGYQRSCGLSFGKNLLTTESR